MSLLILIFRTIQTKDRKEGINENDENSNAQALNRRPTQLQQQLSTRKKYFKKFNGAQYDVKNRSSSKLSARITIFTNNKIQSRNQT